MSASQCFHHLAILEHVLAVCWTYVFHVSHGILTDNGGLDHYHLWVKGIHHRDISLTNLMCDFPTGTEDPVGILNDFDLTT